MPDFYNISGYKFVRLAALPVLQADMLSLLTPAGVLGTILLADEGINITLAGEQEAIERARGYFATVPALADIRYQQSVSDFLPFARLKIKIRHEIIAFDAGATRPDDAPAPELDPATLKQWLAEGRDFTLLDTRNHYEIESGTFDQAISLGLNTFRDFPAAVTQSGLDRNTPVVTFCTGGIRCEKAAPWMLNNGFREVYQIKGGILNYFHHCSGDHWHGDCFVFDDRVEIDPNLAATGAVLCTHCHRAVAPAEQNDPAFIRGETCPACCRL